MNFYPGEWTHELASTTRWASAPGLIHLSSGNEGDFLQTEGSRNHYSRYHLEKPRKMRSSRFPAS